MLLHTTPRERFALVVIAGLLLLGVVGLLVL